MPPRPALTSRMPGLACASTSAFTRPIVSGVFVAWMVTKSEIATRSSIVSTSCDAELAGAIRADERVVGDESHPERVRALRDQHADPAEADDPERLAVELDALPLRAVPLAGLQIGIGLGHVARLREQQRHACARRPRGCSTAARSRPSRRGASPRRRRRCRARCRPGRRRRDRCPAASTSAVTCVALRITKCRDSRQCRAELFGREAGLDLDVEPGRSHRVEPALGERFGDKNS